MPDDVILNDMAEELISWDWDSLPKWLRTPNGSLARKQLIVAEQKERNTWPQFVNLRELLRVRGMDIRLALYVSAAQFPPPKDDGEAEKGYVERIAQAEDGAAVPMTSEEMNHKLDNDNKKPQSLIQLRKDKIPARHTGGGRGRAWGVDPIVEVGKGDIKATCAVTTSVDWVFENLAVKNVDPQDCPSAGAWGLLQWARASEGNRADFYRNIWPKRLPTRTTESQGTEYTEETGDLDFLSEVKSVASGSRR